MSDVDLEQALRHALRAQDPGAAFGERVLARVAEEARRSAAPGGPATVASAPRTRARRYWLPAALAASLLVGLGVGHWQQLQERRALQARAQLLLALNIASHYVDDARTAVLREEQVNP